MSELMRMRATATATPVTFDSLSREQLLKVVEDLAAEVGRLRSAAHQPAVSIGTNGERP